MSDAPFGPGLRCARGAVVAAVAVGLGSVGHVAAGGLLPPASWCIVIFVSVATVAVVSMGHPAGRTRLVALVGGGQFATHLMLTALAGHDEDHRLVPSSVMPAQVSTADGSSGRRGSLRDLTVGRLEPAGGGEFVVPHWATHILDDLSGPHAAMAVAHLTAAAVVAWWLAQGERALWILLALLGASVAKVLLLLAAVHDIQPMLARPLTNRSIGSWQPRRLLAPLTGGLGRRGPPLIAI